MDQAVTHKTVTKGVQVQSQANFVGFVVDRVMLRLVFV